MLPPAFVRNVTGAFANGAEWLDDLPILLEDCLRRWDLSLAGPPFELSYHYVVPVLRGGRSSAVLKLGVPTPELASEIHALQAFAGKGTAALLDSDASLGALLLESIQPGNTLAGYSDPLQACRFAAQVMQGLWQANIEGLQFRSLESWTAALLRPPALPDAGLVDIAINLRTELLQDLKSETLLHADLHHGNILYGDLSGWVAIDPKGVIGDPAYEPASFLLNPNSTVVLNASLQASRIAAFAEHIEQDRRRIARWALVHAVLSACWTIEDGGHDFSEAISAARIFSQLIDR